MATADVKIYTDAPIVWSATTTGANYLMTMASLTTTSTAAWGGEKGDLGTPRGAKMAVRLQCKFTTNPTAGAVVEVYWSQSPTSTAANDNAGGHLGTNAQYTGLATAANSKRQLKFVGCLIADAATAAQIQDVGWFTPDMRYGSPVVCNLAAVAFTTTTTDHILTIYPVLDQIQASA